MTLAKYGTYEFHMKASELSRQAEARAKEIGHDHLIAHYQVMAAHHAALAARIFARNSNKSAF
jgi:hypothetical protein